MLLKEMIAAEHSKAQCDLIVNYIGSDRTRFAALMDLFFSEEHLVAQRAAWPMSYCIQNHPELVSPYLHRLIKNLKKKNLHDAVVRNTLRLLQDIEVPKKYHGELMDLCFNFIAAPQTAVAIKAFALTILGNLSKEYPEIRPELKLIIEDRLDHETAAFRSRARKILKNENF